MTILLDTQAFLYHLQDNPLLSVSQSQLIENPAHTKFLSIASLWEIAIKTSLGKLSVTQPLDALLPMEISILPITLAHLREVQILPFYHRAPFDRLIIAQARVEGFHVMSRDRNFEQYGISLV